MYFIHAPRSDGRLVVGSAAAATRGWYLGMPTVIAHRPGSGACARSGSFASARTAPGARRERAPAEGAPAEGGPGITRRASCHGFFAGVGGDSMRRCICSIVCVILPIVFVIAPMCFCMSSICCCMPRFFII